MQAAENATTWTVDNLLKPGESCEIRHKSACRAAHHLLARRKAARQAMSQLPPHS
jgi:hypothetical protein